MSDVRMTERTILNAMIDGTIERDVMIEYATRKLAQLDKRNATARVRAAKKKVEDDDLMEAVYNVLSEEPMSREDVLEALLDTDEYRDAELTLGKISYRLNVLSRGDNPRVLKQDAIVAVNEEGRRSKKITVYTIA